MDVSDEDEDLERAIALSLQDVSSTASSKEVISTANSKEVVTLNSDDETTDGEFDKRSRLEAKSHAPPTTSSMIGLDRKAMEQERLARKRKASISPPPIQKSQRLTGSSTKEQPPPPGTARASTPSNLEPDGNDGKAFTKSMTSGALQSLAFPEGIVRKTWAFGHPRTGNDIKIEEVLQRQDLEQAVLSSFQWDVEWLLSKLNTGRSKIMMVMQAKEESTKRQYERDTADMPNLRLCFPPMDGQVNCMHSKLMLLSYRTHLRIVVPTANLVPYDWGETGIMENSVFLIDLPRLTQPTSHDNIPRFGKSLTNFLEAMGMESSIVRSIYNFDFTATRDYAFVHTIGGARTGQRAWRKTGYPGLGRAIQKLKLDTKEDLKLDFVASSLGSFDYDFLSALYRAAQGDDGMTEFTSRYNVMSKKKAEASKQRQANADREALIKRLKQDFRVYFPTHETIAQSTGGPENGGTICFQSRWYNNDNFPRELLRDCRSVRKGMLMHNKILFVRPSSPDSQATPWAYIGSANASSSAWGSLVRDKTLTAKLNCRNWECGVIVPLRNPEQRRREVLSEGRSMNLDKGLGIFEGSVPVPMEHPADGYNGRKPWFAFEHRQ